MNAESSYVCHCERTFPTPGACEFHRRTCKTTKRRLSGALAKAKEIWISRKRQRIDALQPRVDNLEPPVDASESEQSEQMHAISNTTSTIGITSDDALGHEVRDHFLRCG
jgi:hypothetical protein